MIKIDTYIYTNKFNWHLLNDYPSVYILENGKDAYIGESSDVINRTKSHLRNIDDQKYNYERIHIITGTNFNISIVKHYENLLIKLMAADGKFNITNKYNGNQRNYYYKKQEAELQFDNLWEELLNRKLVRKKDFNKILNSSAYKYSPYNTLNKEQEKALTSIIHTLDSNELVNVDKKFLNRPIVVSGEAGTGKTVVASVLYSYLKNNENYKDKNIALVVPNTPSRDEAKRIFKSIKNISETGVLSPSQAAKQKYDILICDEAHKLRRNFNLGNYGRIFKETYELLGLSKENDELDWLLLQAKNLVLFYDSKQIVNPSEISFKTFTKKIKQMCREERNIVLKQQCRTSAKYIKYVYDILYQKAKKKIQFADYDFKLFIEEDASKFKNKMDYLIEHEELARYCGGYSWEWSHDKGIKDVKFGVATMHWNSERAGWIRKEKCKYEFGSIYSLSGIDANYLGVVIGPEVYFDTNDNKIKINKENYYDKKVSNNISDDDLLMYILNTYGVLLTRAIKGTYIYVCDVNLREYFKKYVDIAD